MSFSANEILEWVNKFQDSQYYEDADAVSAVVDDLRALAQDRLEKNGLKKN